MQLTSHENSKTFAVDTKDGWRLRLTRTVNPRALERTRRPVLVVPGYGMNASIFSYHPKQQSLVSVLARSGAEVWTVDLRGLKSSIDLGIGAAAPSIESYVTHDLPAAIQCVLSHTVTDAKALNLVASSMAGAVSYAHVSIQSQHNVHSLVTISSPLRWHSLHPVLRSAFSYPNLLARLPIRGTQTLARWVLPLAKRVDAPVGFYVHTRYLTAEVVNAMCRSVENPPRHVTADMARWMQNGDLLIKQTNLTHAIGNAKIPLLIVVCNQDMTVPPEVSLVAEQHWGGPKTVMRVGTPEAPLSHADVFVADTAPEVVFCPVAKWVADQDRHPSTFYSHHATDHARSFQSPR